MILSFAKTVIMGRRKPAALLKIFHFFVVLFLVFSACTGKHVVKRAPSTPSKNLIQGEASWYGGKFNGRRTASGERYNMYGLTAAHKTLPFGTKLSVVNLANGKTVTVTVNDRGPFVRDRVLDLSYGAAKKIGMIGAGSADIKATILKTSEKYPSAALP
jgi:rare lipoprotein A